MTEEHRQKLHYAIILAAEYGIPPASSFPYVLRSLCLFGLPVRPLHFMSIPGLLTFLVVVTASLVSALHWALLRVEIGSWLPTLGFAEIMLLSAGLSVVIAIVIRVQAIRAGLPGWHKF
ncbi:MAG: DUF6404 family protein [Tabrizicola sp.]|jgi:hypothetical protein|nr:DUF6404 family protein [Tabrizicola sp.]